MCVIILLNLVFDKDLPAHWYLKLFINSMHALVFASSFPSKNLICNLCKPFYIGSPYIVIIPLCAGLYLLVCIHPLYAIIFPYR